MKRGLHLVNLLVFISLISTASASLTISGLEEIYNYGDELSASVNVVPEENSNDFLTVDLECESGQAELYRNTFQLDAGEEATVSIGPTTLDPDLLGGLSGNCTLGGHYESESGSSGVFLLSNTIILDVGMDSDSFTPGDTVHITGTAYKDNGMPAHGHLEINVNTLDIEIDSNLSSGDIEYDFSLPDHSPYGLHEIDIYVSEVNDEGDTLNSGNQEIFITVEQVITELQVILETREVEPGEPVTYRVVAYDQTGEIVDEQVNVRIYEPGDFEHKESFIRTNEDIVFETGDEFVPGYWKIEAEVAGSVSRRLFYVAEDEQAFFSLIDDTLVATNVGNVPYSEAVDVNIGSNTKALNVDLEIGETKQYKLHAPDGSYQISVETGEEQEQLGTSALTGNAVSIEEVGVEDFKSSVSLIFWVIGILVFAMVLLYAVSQARNGNLKLLFTRFTGMKKSVPKATLTQGIRSGVRESAAVLAIKDNSNSSRRLNEVLQTLVNQHKKRPHLYRDGSYTFLLFSPSLMSENTYNMQAIDLAMRLENAIRLQSVNQTESMKVGLAVHNGEIISEHGKHGFKFATLGSLIPIVKRLAKQSENEILLSDEMRKSVITKVNSEKSEKGLGWKITKFRNQD